MKAAVGPSICSQSLWAKCSKLFSKESKVAAARPSGAPVFVIQWNKYIWEDQKLTVFRV